MFLRKDDSVRKAIGVLNKSKCQIILVIDKNKKLIGTVTDGDIRRSIAKGNTLDCDLKKLMNKAPIKVKENENFSNIQKIMKNNSILQIPEVNKNGKVINNEDSKTASILLVVVDNNGNPIKLEGPSGKMTEFVFTNMLLPDPSGERFSGIEGDTGISQDAWLNITDQYTASRQAVLNSKDGITFNITGFSKGVPNLQTIDGEYVKGSVVGRLVTNVEDVKNIRLQVATEQDKDGFTAIAMGTTSYKAKLGMIYAHHKSRPVPMELRTLNNGEIETVMQILMGHGRAVYSTDEAVSSSARIIPGTDNISVFDRLHDLIKFGEWKNKGKTHSPKYSIHLETKGEEKYIVFAGERILLQSIDPTAQPRTSVTVVEGKAQEVTTPVYNAENAQKLRDFLATKMHNVNLKTLKSTEKYTEVQINSEGEVKEDEYANYGEYLMKPRATMSDTPLTTSLVPMVERGKKGEDPIIGSLPQLQS